MSIVADGVREKPIGGLNVPLPYLRLSCVLAPESFVSAAVMPGIAPGRKVVRNCSIPGTSVLTTCGCDATINGVVTSLHIPCYRLVVSFRVPNRHCPKSRA